VKTKLLNFGRVVKNNDTLTKGICHCLTAKTYL
jgi:hypothetical protein